MRFRSLISAASIGALMSLSSAMAASRPSNATAQCTDGTYSTAKTKQGACSKHGGVQTWFGDQAPASAPVAPARPAAAHTTAIPKNSTAQCNDGTYSSAKTKSGACSKHGGVRTWYADQAPAPAPLPPTRTPPAPRQAGRTASTAPAPNPQNATARCNDGTLSFSAQHSGACSHHGGVAQWYK
jgi:hypothetical protein